MPRQARTASPINPRMAPTAMKTVPSGTFVVCMYGAFAVGGTVTTGPDVDVEEEDVESVVEETDDVDVLLDVDDDDDEEDVDVDDMLVEVEELELDVDFVDEVDEDEDEDEVVLTLSVVEEGSAVVLAASVVVFSSFAGSAATRAAIARSSTNRKKNDGWALPSLRRKSLIVVSFARSLCQCAGESAVLHSGSAGVVDDQERKCSDKGIDEFNIGALLKADLKWAVVENWGAISSTARNVWLKPSP